MGGPTSTSIWINAGMAAQLSGQPYEEVSANWTEARAQAARHLVLGAWSWYEHAPGDGKERGQLCEKGTRGQQYHMEATAAATTAPALERTLVRWTRASATILPDCPASRAQKKYNPSFRNMPTTMMTSTTQPRCSSGGLPAGIRDGSDGKRENCHTSSQKGLGQSTCMNSVNVGCRQLIAQQRNAKRH